MRKQKEFTHSCKRCGYKWDSNIKPVSCPKCKSYAWNEEKIKNGE